jgi:two-component system phosphate regulon sensor histidine kinase PhoR
LFFAGIVIIIGVVTILVSRQVSEPLVTMVKTVNRFREGEMTARINGRYMSEELTDLAKAINGMAEKLNADIAKLERLERVRSEFLGNVSHELRTPIFSLQGFLETLLDGAVDDPAVNRAFLAKAHAHSERLNALLNDLIEISRIESGEMKMSFRYFSILEFLDGIVEEYKLPAQAKGISMTLESEFDASAKVYGDRSRLRQVMSNLIDNAIKYTESGKTVVVQGRAVRNQCEILVRDTGAGIPPEHLSRIFERFYRVDKDRSREIGGTGLGLAIVKHIVEAHGSTIEVSSTIGRGSTFSFKLKR